MKFEGKFKKFREKRTKLKYSVQSYLSDESIDIDERWEVFVNVPDGLLDVAAFKLYLHEYVDVYGPLDFMNDFYYKRGEIVYYEDVVEALLDSKYHNVEQIRKFKEAALNTGYLGFVNDW